MIHKTPNGYCVSLCQVWLPGVYESERAARYASRLPDNVLRELQIQAGLAAITLKALKRARWALGKGSRKMQSTMAVMGKEGDTKTVWNKDNPDEVEAARAQFNTLKTKGYLAFKVKDDGDKGEMIKEFDPSAQKIILSPPVMGG